MVAPLHASELPAAIALLDRVGLSGAVASVARYLRWQPDGAWGVTERGALIGMVTLLGFGEVGFVGCMAVEPAHQGRGLGRRLLEHAHAAGRRAGVTTFLLEATPDGQPLYTRLGYVVDHETCNVVRPAAPPGVAAAPVVPGVPGVPDIRDLRIGPITGGDDLAAIRALDQRATGMPRDRMISDLLAGFPGAIERTDTLAAYGILVAGRVGPVIASDPGAGRAVIDRLAAAALASPSPAVASVPGANEPAMAAFADHGFTTWRTLRRMRLGPPVAAKAGWTWALSSPGAG